MESREESRAHRFGLRQGVGRCLATVCAALVALLAAGAAALAGERPNLVVVMADDLDLSVWDTALAHGYLPRIQADLIDRGLTFTQAFVTESMCCPSRTTLLTGQYPHNHGVIRNTGRRGGFQRFTRDDSTVAVWLQQAGYRTGLVGKYLNGYGDAPGYVPPGWDAWNAVLDHKQYDYRMSIDGVLRRYGSHSSDYQPDVLAGVAESFIADPDPRPFFLLVTPVAPHYEDLDGSDEAGGVTVRPAPRYAATPAVRPIPPEGLASFDEADLSDKPAWMRGAKPVNVPLLREGYNSKVAAMRGVDDLVGRIVDALRGRGLLDRTAIVFTSDNGFQYGTHRRNQKTDHYEESVRIPAVLRPPGGVAARRLDDWIANTDWAPTLVDFAGARADLVADGRSLKPLVDGGIAPGRHSLLLELPVDPSGGGGGHPAFRALRSKDPALTGDAAGRRTLVFAEVLADDGRVKDREFYDLDSDPLQLDSLHASGDASRQAQMARMAARLNALARCRAADCRRLEDGR